MRRLTGLAAVLPLLLGLLLVLSPASPASAAALPAPLPPVGSLPQADNLQAAGAVVAVCSTPFATAGYPPGWSQVTNTTYDWDTTDGNIIAQEVLYTAGGPYLAIGGNFTIVHDPTQGAVPVRNLAVIRIRDGHVMWGAGSMTGYVKTIQARWGQLYIGGTFTSINGVARHSAAAFNAFNYALLPWQPAVTGAVTDIEVSLAGVAYLSGNGLWAVRTDNAARVWSTTSNAPILTLLLTPDETGLYVGGIFTTLAGVSAPNLAELSATGPTVQTRFNPHLRPSMPGTYDGEVVLDPLRWDTSTGGLRLVVGTGGSGSNSVKELDPYFGGWFWSHDTEGDTQALAVLGNTVLSGNHRSHGNVSTGCPYQFVGVQWSNSGFVLPWVPGLSGPKSTQASIDSGANGGISDILVEPQSHKVFVVGDFTTWGAVCNYMTLVCTGGVPKRGLAVYDYSGA